MYAIRSYYGTYAIGSAIIAAAEDARHKLFELVAPKLGAAPDDLDVIGLAMGNGMASVHVLFIRQGKVLGSRAYFPKMPADAEREEILHAFLLQFYLSGLAGRQLPSEVLLDTPLDDEEALARNNFV